MRAASQASKLATMSRADKFRFPTPALRCALSRKGCLACVWLFAFFACCFAGCDRVTTSRYAQQMQDADVKSAQGDFDRAINLYEAALDDTPRCAEVHYQLALLYDDKLKDPLNALHHFKRYLVLSPNGPRANEIRASIKRDEVDLLTNLSGDAVLTGSEAARLRNENLSLRKELEERR